MPLTRRWTRGATAAAALSYLLLAVVLWWGAWSRGVGTHTLCGCGDPALFLWFFQWPATALAHGHNPFYSTALFHPGGINLLAQTSVTGLSIPLVPVTWIFGPVAALNVASTLAPVLSACAMCMVLRRWVKWGPAAYLGGLLYGFSPTVLVSLQYAHLMTAAVMLLPLILALLDEIVLRQRHGPFWPGVLLGLLVFLQFFMSSELLAVTALLVVLSLLILAVAGLMGDRDRLRRLAPHALEGLLVGTLASAILLAYPVWFALDGPAHLSGLVWPGIGAVGGFDGSSFVSPNITTGASLPTVTFGSYAGSALPSAAYLGWGFLGVVLAGLVIWFRDRRLWFFGLLLAICAASSLGERPGEWEPARIFAHIPVIENVIEQRFMVVGFLAAAVMLAVILDHVRTLFPPRLHLSGPAARLVGVGAALGVAAVALVPIGAGFGSALPFAMRAVVLPRWYATVAPDLPPGRVLLSYPAPFSGIQVSMAWQAVNRMTYSQAGGGGPQGVAARAGSARTGFEDLGRLAFGIDAPQPTTAPADLAAVRHALAVWRVTTVVIAPQPSDQLLLQGHDPIYAAAFMTAVLGRLPAIEAGAWVWNDVAMGAAPSARPALRVTYDQLVYCVAASKPRSGAPKATLRVARCLVKAAAP